MKRNLTILTVVVVFFAAILLITRFTESRPSNVQLVFLGYTNTSAGPEAVFAMRFPADFGGCGFGDLQMSHKEGVIWKSWSPADPACPKGRWFSGPSQRRAFGALEPKAESFIAFSMKTTNEALRIVIEIHENPRESGTGRALRALWAWITRNPGTPTLGPRYLVTNETTRLGAW